jgi:hypothetical protein
MHGIEPAPLIEAVMRRLLQVTLLAAALLAPAATAGAQAPSLDDFQLRRTTIDLQALRRATMTPSCPSLGATLMSY